MPRLSGSHLVYKTITWIVIVTLLLPPGVAVSAPLYGPVAVKSTVKTEAQISITPEPTPEPDNGSILDRRPQPSDTTKILTASGGNITSPDGTVSITLLEGAIEKALNSSYQYARINQLSKEAMCDG